jgi:hypothetical protein
MGVVLPRPKMDIIESVKRCVDNPSPGCCSRRLYATIVLLWYLANTKKWLTTRELCGKARFRNCNEARVYLYRLKERGIVVTNKIHTGETIWRLNEEALKHMDPRAFLRLLTRHYNMCTEYYKTGNLKPLKEDIEEEEFEEDVEDNEE